LIEGVVPNKGIDRLIVYLLFLRGYEDDGSVVLFVGVPIALVLRGNVWDRLLSHLEDSLADLVRVFTLPLIVFDEVAYVVPLFHAGELQVSDADKRL
jgi:hypothetical protein